MVKCAISVLLFVYNFPFYNTKKRLTHGPDLLYDVFVIICQVLIVQGVFPISSQSDIAYQQIKEMIFHLELLPGMRIPELQIASKLSISRTPIHDALRRLAAEGLVVIGPRRGATVTCFSESEIREIGAIRMLQDILAAQLAAYYGSASDFEQLDRLADACEAAASRGDVYGRIRTDIDFHMAISEISGNSHLIKQQYDIYQQIHLIHVSQYTDIPHSLLQIHHHRPLIAAIRSGDLSEIKSLICQHVKDFYHIDPYILRCCSDSSGCPLPADKEEERACGEGTVNH